MKINVIKSETEYNKVCKRIYQLMHTSDQPIDSKSKLGEELELLALLVEKYESNKYRIDPPNPIEAIKFRLDQMDLNQSDIAPLMGGKSRVSEVLNGKRQLTIKMIILLNRYLGIPYESLLNNNKKIKLDSKKQNLLLNIPAIKNQFAKNKIGITS